MLEAFRSTLRKRSDLFLVLAPRHPERCDDVEVLVRGAGLQLQRLSRLDGPLPAATDVLLVDTLGQLGRLYGLGEVAFVGIGDEVDAEALHLICVCICDCVIGFSSYLGL